MKDLNKDLGLKENYSNCCGANGDKYSNAFGDGVKDFLSGISSAKQTQAQADLELARAAQMQASKQDEKGLSSLAIGGIALAGIGIIVTAAIIIKRRAKGKK